MPSLEELLSSSGGVEAPAPPEGGIARGVGVDPRTQLILNLLSQSTKGSFPIAFPILAAMFGGDLSKMSQQHSEQAQFSNRMAQQEAQRKQQDSQMRQLMQRAAIEKALAERQQLQTQGAARGAISNIQSQSIPGDATFAGAGVEAPAPEARQAFAGTQSSAIDALRPLLSAQEQALHKPPADFTLGPEDIRFGPHGQEIARGKGKAPSTDRSLNTNDLTLFVTSKGKQRGPTIPPTMTLAEGESALKDMRSQSQQRIDITTKGQSFTQEKTLRDQYIMLTKDFRTVTDFKIRLDAALPLATPMSDMASIFSFQKILDSQSVVRESEQESVRKARGLLDTLLTQIPRIQSGESLTPTQRKQLKEASDAMYAVASSVNKNLRGETRRLAVSHGINPANVTIDYTPEVAPTPVPSSTTPSAAGGAQRTLKLKDGTIVTIQ